MPHCTDCDCVLSESYERRWGTRRTNADGELVCAECAGVYDGTEIATDGGQPIDATERKALKFDSGPSTTLAIAQKANSLAATIRYDDEKGISEGEEIDVLSALTGEKIGVATVEYTETVPVQRALDVVHQRWAEYGITQPDTLVSRLNDYYDDVITRLTDVKVIILDPDLRQLQSEGERDRGSLEPAHVIVACILVAIAFYAFLVVLGVTAP